MPLLIDTFNVLHTTGVLPPDLAGIDVLGLIGLLQQSRYANDRITLACDGSPHTTGQDTASAGSVDELDGFTIRHSGPVKTADDLIIELIKLNTAPRRLVVVSSDHQILRAARKRRCKVFSSPEFLQQLADDARLPRPSGTRFPKPRTAMTDQQVASWMSIFKLNAAAPEMPEAPPLPLSVQDHLLEDEAEEGKVTASEIAIEAEIEATNDDDHSPEELVLRDKISKGLPLSLIEQAERLVQDHERKHRASRAEIRAEAFKPNAVQVEKNTEAGAEVAKPKLALHTAELSLDDRRIDAVDPDQIDMNSILPQDGRTRAFNRTSRRQPPPLPPA